MTPDQHHRLACRLHMMRRMAERGLDLTVFEVFRIERRLHRARMLFERPGSERYLIALKLGRQRHHVVYDARLRVLVTVLRSEMAGSRNWIAMRGGSDG